MVFFSSFPPDGALSLEKTPRPERATGLPDKKTDCVVRSPFYLQRFGADAGGVPTKSFR